MTDLLPDADPTPKPRGLWSLMPKTSTALPSETEFSEPSPVLPKSLFDVIRQAAEGDEHSPNPVPFDASLESHPVDEDPAHALTDIPVRDFSVVVTASLYQAKSSALAARKTRRHLVEFGCGLASVGFSALAMRPEFVMSLPGLVLGFSATILGSLRLSESRSRSFPARDFWISVAGILSGILGIFLGPLYFTELGRVMRESSGNNQTQQHLNQIGSGLKRHHDQHEAFPAGGTFVRLPSGKLQGLHGWMTLLLPDVGEALVYRQIDLSKPFDALVNRRAMGHEISVYYAAGGDRSRIGDGFAIAHFAGVGGDLESESGILQAGIFARETPIRRDEVIDGLANTFAAGELAGNFPPWGDPHNLRTVGRGLNKDVNGFGNSNGNGALFLFADGSVKFFENRTDSKVLRQLSSRNGHDE